MKNRKLAAFVSYTLFLSCLTLVALLSDLPLRDQKNGNLEQCGVLAIRDNVTPFQKAGSRLFSLPYFQKYYGSCIYLEQNDRSDQKEAFIRSLDSLLDVKKAVDVFLLSHGNYFYEWAAEVDSIKRKRLRLVYNTGCNNAWQCGNWLKLGAQAYVGHKHEQSFSPVFYFYFLRRWCSGQVLQEATTRSNERMKSRFSWLNDLLLGLLNREEHIVNHSDAGLYGTPSLSINNK